MDAKVDALRRLVEVVERLRAPGGCPWDREQSLSDVGRYLLAEASEVVDAIEEAGGRPAPAVCEELGDLLMNVIFAARIAEEEGAFSLAEVAEGIREKLVRRHPHVFGRGTAATADEVLARWEEIKAEEHAQEGKARRSVLDGIPKSLPPLTRAYEISRKAAKVGFDWPDARCVLDKVEEEIEEVREVLEERAGREASVEGEGGAGRTSAGAAALDRLSAELGDLLFALVNLCRKAGVRPESALLSTVRKFESRFREIERRFGDLEGVELERMEAVWDELRSRERTGRAARTANEGGRTAEGREE